MHARLSRLGRREAEQPTLKAAQRRELAFRLYQEMSLPDLADKVATASGLDSRYNEAAARYDLWHYYHARLPHEHSPATGNIYSRLDLHRNEYNEAGYADLMVAVVAHAYADLRSGRPCTLGINHTIVGADTSHCSPSGAGGEQHSCCQDALAWLTSMEFLELCETMDWSWSEHMEAVLREASVTASLYPFVPLVAALVWRIACVLTGEAADLGPQGMYLVADTMLGRRASGQTWDEVLSAYYAYREPPTEDAMRLANRMLRFPWKPSGRIYAYSEADRLEQGWPRGEIVYQRGEFVLHFGRSLSD